MMVYLLHLDTPLSHAKHYMGSCDDLDARLERHRTGSGARMLAVCIERGIGVPPAEDAPSLCPSGARLGSAMPPAPSGSHR